MIRIVGVQRSADRDEELLLLQNQGAMKVNLRGYALVADRELFDKESPQALHLLRDNVDIPSGQFVLIRTGRGEPRWSLTKDGRRIFCTYMQRDASVWGDCEGPIHLLRPQHSYCQRSTEAVSIR